MQGIRGRGIRVHSPRPQTQARLRAARAAPGARRWREPAQGPRQWGRARSAAHTHGCASAASGACGAGPRRWRAERRVRCRRGRSRPRWRRRRSESRWEGSEVGAHTGGDARASTHTEAAAPLEVREGSPAPLAPPSAPRVSPPLFRTPAADRPPRRGARAASCGWRRTTARVMGRGCGIARGWRRARGGRPPAPACAAPRP